MLAEERKARILEMLKRDIVIKVTDLSRELCATEATIRRDLDELQQKKMARRIHGGATLPRPAGKPLNRTQLMVLCKKEKAMIAKRAFEFIQESDAILLDSSTTVLELAKCIAESQMRDITVITNSFYAIPLLAGNKGIKVLHTGGAVSYDMDYSTGVVTRNMLSGIRVDKCFLGTNGIDPSFGYSVPTMDDADVKRSMIKAAKQSFILADHTKFAESFMGRFADFSGEVDYLITDQIPAGMDRKPYDSSVGLIEVAAARQPTG